MENLVEKINNISNVEQFISFVNELSADAKDNPDEWENIDYKTFAKILYMGKIYE